MTRHGSVTVPHQVPLEQGPRNVTDAIRWRLIMTAPDLDARKAGQDAFYAGQSRESNPWPVLTPAWANWDYGWSCERELNS